VYSIGTMLVEVQFGVYPYSMTLRLSFLVVDAPSTYNGILGKGALNKLGEVVSTSHLKMKFSTLNIIGSEQRC
jgi:hypothetical protein